MPEGRPLCEGEHRYEPLVVGLMTPDGPIEFIHCQDCPHRMMITEEVRQRWLDHYEECVREGKSYNGIYGRVYGKDEPEEDMVPYG